MNQDFEVKLFPMLESNYAFFLLEKSTKKIYLIDTPDGEAIYEIIRLENYTVEGILNTHHHPDHVGGNKFLKARLNCEIFGPKHDMNRIPALTKPVAIGETIPLFGGKLHAEIIDLTGHTLGLIGYYISEMNICFVGDALFNLGCGYLFEGTLEQMWSSMLRLRNLPDTTMIYAAHEYLERNAEFAISLSPEDGKLLSFIETMRILLDETGRAMPMNLESQKRFNPFLNADSIYFKRITDTIGQSDANTFGRLREMKNMF